eukprot:gnl/TRDRNA2_/TRDRNA2_82504_c0_seq3.p1 gnl/TRDRNA2_/TRDRNA2_82504_c0~~gnl/TRDRNA2_/TRDRNA2_82504_c0_seq3.p1  ORF type:complete len:324 (+),score=46.49 gnl/TRDRNA2_/TRDRNA2_82504_c0_seq3:53-1024(+)
MLAVRCAKYAQDPSDAVVVERVPEPSAAALRKDQVLIQVLSCGVDFVQLLMLQGKYQLKIPTPFTLGGEVTGKVLAIGDGVHELQVGDLVHGGAFGAWQEQIVLPASSLLRLPHDVRDPARVPSLYGYATSIHALQDRANLRSGETLLVLGASGGVGCTAVEYGKLLGATVIAAASTAAKLQTCREVGADHLINYESEDLKARVREITRGRGVDVVFDPVGDRFTEPAVRALAWRGRYIVVGFAGGDIPKVATNLLLLKEASLFGSALREAANMNPRAARMERDEIVTLFTAGRLNPLVTSVVDLEKAIIQSVHREDTFGNHL